MIIGQGEFKGKTFNRKEDNRVDEFVNHLPDGKDLTEMSQSAFSETPYAGCRFLD